MRPRSNEVEVEHDVKVTMPDGVVHHAPGRLSSVTLPHCRA